MREGALAVLRRDRAKREETVRAKLKEAFNAPDRRYGGTTHTAIQAVTILHAENAIPDLLDSIDFTLDPSTFPVGGFQGVEESYPVAKALRDIGGRSLTKKLLESATRELTDSSVKVHAWVLIEVLGRECAGVAIDNAGRSSRGRRALEKLKGALDDKVLLPPARVDRKPRPAPVRNRERASSAGRGGTRDPVTVKTDSHGPTGGRYGKSIRQSKDKISNSFKLKTIEALQVSTAALLFLASAAVTADSEKMVDDLSSESAEARAAAVAAAVKDREQLEALLRAELEQAFKQPDHAYLGRTHSVLKVVERVRATNTIDILIKNIRFTLAPGTFPHGGKVAIIAYYPAAQTLIALGDKRVAEKVLKGLADGGDELALRIYARVLVDIAGVKPALALADRARIGKGPAARANLDRLKATLEGPPEALPSPVFRDKRVKGV